MWKPIVAGVLNIISAVLICDNALWVYSTQEIYPLSPRIFMGSMALLVSVSVIIATLTLVSGVLTTIRKGWGLALIGSIAMCAYVVYYFVQSSFSLYLQPMFWGWVGIPAFVLIAFSRNEFKKQFKQQKDQRVLALEQQKEQQSLSKTVLGGVIILFGCILVPICLVVFGMYASFDGEIPLTVILFLAAIIVFVTSVYIIRKLSIKMPDLVWF